MNLSFVKDTFQKKNRSSILMLNVLASFFIKGWSALVVLIMVPLTLECLGKYKNGVGYHKQSAYMDRPNGHRLR